MARNVECTSRKFAMESLESRRMMAGVVTAWVDANMVLHLQGDAKDNRVAIVYEGGKYTVKPTDNTVVVDKVTGAVRTQFSPFTRIVAQMGAGNDQVEIGRRGSPILNNTFASISIDVGTGPSNNVYFSTGVSVTGNLTITGQGSSVVYVEGAANGATKTVGGQTTIHLGDGQNRIGLKGEYGSVDIATGSGSDDVGLGGFATHSQTPYYNNFRARTLTVFTGGGNDTLRLYNGEVADRLFADMGGGNFDFMHLAFVKFPQSKGNTTAHSDARNAVVELSGIMTNYPGPERFTGFHLTTG